MKYLVDAQLPKALSYFLVAKGIDAIHTLELPDKNKTSDAVINMLSVEENRVVITKDDDFLQSYLIHKTPTNFYLLKREIFRIKP